MSVLKIRDKNGKFISIFTIKGPKGEQGEKGKDAVTDRTYNPQSENAQSGKAVAEAINGIPIAQAIPLPSALGSQLKPGLYFEKSGLSRVVGEINGEPLNEFFVKSSMADITQDSIFYIHVAKEGQTANSAVITIIGRGYYLDCDKPRNIAEYRVTNNSWEDITVDRNYVDTAIGSIETALDSIIAIQEQLIGGAV